jgi:DNA-binding NtrC family response regulator
MIAHPQISTPLPPALSPLARGVLDACAEGVVVFDQVGRVAYANQRAHQVLGENGELARETADRLMPRLAALGGRIVRLRTGSLSLGEAVFLPSRQDPSTLAQREREAILETLEASRWKLSEAARRLGISRTTLWRRLKAYGFHRDEHYTPTPPAKSWASSRRSLS